MNKKVQATKAIEISGPINENSPQKIDPAINENPLFVEEANFFGDNLNSRKQLSGIL
jgi:hypothetical protein